MIVDNELEEHFEKLKNDETYISFFVEYARENLIIDPLHTKKVLEAVVEITKSNNFEIGYAWSILWLGWYYHDISKYDKAIAYHTEALNIFLENNENTGLSSTYNALMGDHIKVGILDLAIEYSLNGLALAEELKDNYLILTFLINTAIAYRYGGHYNEIDILLDRISHLNITISPNSRLIIKSIKAEREIHYGNYEKACSHCLESLEIIRNNNLIYLDTSFLHLLAKAHSKMSLYEKAEKEFKLATEKCIEYCDISTLVEILIDWAKSYYELGNYEASKDKLLSAIKYGEEISADNLLYDAYNELGNIYSELGLFNEAYKATKKSMLSQQKTFNNNSSIWFSKLKSKTVVDEARMYKDLYNQVNNISKIGKNIIASLNTEKTLESIYVAINTLMKADIFGLALHIPEDNSLHYEFFVEKGQCKSFSVVSLDDTTSIGIDCFKNDKEVIINDITTEYTEFLTHTYKEISCEGNNILKSSMFCPLKTGTKTLGIITVQSSEKDAYDYGDLNKLKLLSSFIAVALENAKLFKEVEYLANYDSLTDIFNRRETLRLGEQLINQCIKDSMPSTIVMIDIDEFKKINDTYGHQTGDYILKNLSSLLKNNLSHEHLLGRYGGEEFLLILPNTNINKAKDFTENLRESIINHDFILEDGPKINTSVSIGIFEINNPNSTFYEGIKYADRALYKAKSLGRNKVVAYD